MIQLAGFCMFSRNTKQYKKINATSNFEREDKSTSSSNSSTSTSTNGERGNNGGIRVMVVVDLRVESAAALQWALSHTLHAHLHSIILLLVINNSSKQGGNYDRELAQKAYQLLCLMKNMCHTKRPGVRVEISVKEGKEKGPTIVEEAKKQRATLLVLGRPRKQSIVLLRLWKIWAQKRSHKRAMEYYHYYCIHNANCMTIAVRRKSSKYGGGYLITTKRHQDFWLLA